MKALGPRSTKAATVRGILEQPKQTDTLPTRTLSYQLSLFFMHCTLHRHQLCPQRGSRRVHLRPTPERPARPPPLHHQCRQPAAVHATTIQPFGVLFDHHARARVVPVHHRLSRPRPRPDLLVVVPHLPPGQAVGTVGRGRARARVDGAHVHGGEGVLAAQRDARDEARVRDGDVVQPREGADVQNDGALGEPVELGLREGGCKRAIGSIAVRTLVGEVRVGSVAVVGGCRGVSEKEAVLVIAAYARGAEGAEELDGAGGVGAFVDHIASQDQVVRGRAEVELLE